MNKISKLLKPIIALSALTLSLSSQATIVEFDVTISNEVKKVKVNLFDETTPITVSNFLKYVNDGRYTDTVIHRAIDGFIVQGGGFTFENELPLTAVDADSAIQNEPVWSNVKGTIAMAKIGSQVDSATNQWFFNLENNSANLDLQNGGFTVFGQVIEGMESIESITSLSFCGEIPMPDYSQDHCSNGDLPGVENFVTINQITIYDPDVTSANNLSLVKNTLIEDANKIPDTNNSSSGGSFAWFSLLAFGLIPFRKKTK